MTLYALTRFLHVLAVTVLVGGSVATDMALSAHKRSPGEGLRQLVDQRLRPLERAAAGTVLVLGLALLFLNPMGMTIFTSGGWAHLKVSTGLLATVGLLVADSAPAAKWSRPVRGISQLGMIVAIFAIEFLRPFGV